MLTGVFLSGIKATNKGNKMNYYEKKAISFSQLKWMLRSEKHFWHNCILNPEYQPNADTDTLRFGRALHAALLEPSTFMSRYPIAPDLPKNTKEGKEAWFNFLIDGKKDFIKPAELFDCLGMAKSLQNEVIDDGAGRVLPLSSVFKNGQAEIELYWKDEETGLELKAKPDWVLGSLVVDYKSTTDARQRAFTRSVAEYKYYMQAAFYIMGLKAVKDIDVKAFVFIAQEKDAPYVAAPHILCPESLDFGMRSVRECLRKAAKGLETGKWAGYTTECFQIQIPDYEFNV